MPANDSAIAARIVAWSRGFDLSDSVGVENPPVTKIRHREGREKDKKCDNYRKN